MSQINLLEILEFQPKSLQLPISWMGHLSFAAWLIKELDPKIVVELGTHSGNSYFAFCQSVAENGLATQCYAVDTWEGDVHAGEYGEEIYTKVASHNQQNYAAFSQLLRMTFDEAVALLPDGSIELLHIDGLHTYEAVRHDFETWLPKLAPGAVVLFHDTDVRERDFGVWKFWQELQEIYPNNIEFSHSNGLGVLQLNDVAATKILQWLQPDYSDKSKLIAGFAALGARQLERFEFVELKQHATNLSQLLSQRNDDIADLTNYIANLNGRIAYLDRHVGTLTELKHQLQALNDDLRKEVSAYRNSTSWRITRPLRVLAKLPGRASSLFCLYQNYRQQYPGAKGLIRLTRQSYDAVSKGGIKGLQRNIALHAHSRVNASTPRLPKVLSLTAMDIGSSDLPQDIAVHIHLFYPELATEIAGYLKNIPVPFCCYITTDSLDKQLAIKDVFAELPNIANLNIRVVTNRGRDIAPMLVEFGAELSLHEIVLHIHTKRSPHNLALRGWRRYLMMALLGDRLTISAILQQFAENKQLGILYPQIYRPVIPFMRVGGNAELIKVLLTRSGNDESDLDQINFGDFPAGSMFWFRGKAIEPLVKMQLTLQDFADENSQSDATTAHAIERLFPYFLRGNNLTHHAFMPEQLLSPEPGVIPLNLFIEYCETGLIENSVIIFDHNVGGGTNRYSQELINSTLIPGVSVLRIYCDQESWFIEWISYDDGLIFHAEQEQVMFNALCKVGSRHIIVNSLYGYPDVDSSIVHIIKLTEQLNAELECKIHDFYAICPSQHLIDFTEKYCGVPRDQNDCNLCLKNNPAAHWASNRPVAINEWRSSFRNLFAKANAITVFDSSSIDILQQAFELPVDKLKIVPHGDNYFENNQSIVFFDRLHIGVLGTLSTIKGAAVINNLAQYLDEERSYVPITVVGQSLIATYPGIRVYGAYENSNLPDILNNEGINLILMPSIVPETFSYTISEAIKLGLPIVAFDIGAQGARVRQYHLGKVVPLTATSSELLDTMQSAFKLARELKR